MYNTSDYIIIMCCRYDNYRNYPYGFTWHTKCVFNTFSSRSEEQIKTSGYSISHSNLLDSVWKYKIGNKVNNNKSFVT